MDQKSLYQLQVVPEFNDKEGYHISAQQRDQFVVDYIGQSFSQKNYVKIAELSIGEGFLTRSLPTKLDDIELLGVDISETRIKLVNQLIDNCNQKVNSKVRFSCLNLDTEFNFINDNEFDVVIALDIMEHLFDVFGFMNNCYRILKNDGILFLRVPNVAYVKHRIGLLFGNIPITASWFGQKGDLTAWQNRWGWDGGHLHYFTIPLLRQLLEEAQFQIEMCRDPGTKFSFVRNIFPSLLYSNPLIVARKII